MGGCAGLYVIDFMTVKLSSFSSAFACTTTTCTLPRGIPMMCRGTKQITAKKTKYTFQGPNRSKSGVQMYKIECPSPLLSYPSNNHSLMICILFMLTKTIHM